MCSVAFAIPVINLVVGSEQRKDAKRAAKVNIDAVQRSLATQRASVYTRASEEMLNIDAAKMDTTLKADKTEGIARASASGESGVKGANLQRVLNSIRMEEGRYLATMDLNEKYLNRATLEEIENVNAVGRARIEAIKASIPKGPSLFGTALSFATTALSVYAMGGFEGLGEAGEVIDKAAKAKELALGAGMPSASFDFTLPDAGLGGAF